MLDFGLAKLGERLQDSEDSVSPETGQSNAADKLTVDGTISGTPGYMSPEQYRGHGIDARSDQFSFCSALYEALFGRPPTVSQPHAKLPAKSVSSPDLRRPRDSRVPEEIHRALARGLAIRPEQRFLQMEDLLAALLLETTDSAEAAASSRKRFIRWSLLCGMVLTVGTQVARASHTLQYRHLFMTSALMIAVLLVVGLAQRQSLLGNAYHRRMWLLMLIPAVQHLGQRLIGWHLGLPLQQVVVPFELISLTGVAALGGALVSRSMFWMAGALFIATAAMTLVGAQAGRYVAPIYSITLFWMLWEWTKGSESAKRRSTGISLGGPSSSTRASATHLSPL